ncbi:MAG: AAA family ATPase [Firmicutes bacterium]|nr:AAA family ATPase [Bacillota bacterium]
MKLIFIIGSGAVGKMTVGQELMKITDLRLFHNHMTIEPVLEIFGYYDGKTINELREAVFRNFACSDVCGMIFTYMWDFDSQSDWDYIEYVKSIFEPYQTTFYCVELIADAQVRKERNKTENRLKHKASKRDLEWSDETNRRLDENHRLVSREGEVPFENYLRIDNTRMSAEEAAALIKREFGL